LALPDTTITNGWALFAHPLFLKQIDTLTTQVKKLKEKYPKKYKEKNATKRLAAILDLAFNKIPNDPSAPEFRQGNTLGNNNKHWFRAKFFQQYRLFFRYSEKDKVIIYAWVNDEKSKRAYDSKTDCYLIFEKMLKNGNPPNDWDSLITSIREWKLNQLTA